MLCIIAVDYFKPLYPAHFQRFRVFRMGLENEIDDLENHGRRRAPEDHTACRTIDGFFY